MSGWHRHISANIWKSLPETVSGFAEHGLAYHGMGPFRYCELCKCIPTKIVAPDPEPQSVKEPEKVDE